MSKDFRASQIETSKLIASGGISGTTLGLAIYSGSIATDRAGAVSDIAIFNDVGSDVFLFISGSKNLSTFNRENVTLFGGDIVISGTLYAERQVIEVDGQVDGDMIVTGSLLVKPDANSSNTVVFRQADGTNIFVIDSSTPKIMITGSVEQTGDLSLLANSALRFDNPGGNLQFIQGNGSTLTIDADNIMEFAYDNAARFRLNGSEQFELTSVGATFNDLGLSTNDFRIESDALQGAILVDAGENTVVLGSNATTFASLPDESKGSDVAIVLSGSAGTKDSSTRGVVLIPGDMVISGSAYYESSIQAAGNISMLANSRLQFNNPGENDQYIYGNNSNIILETDKYLNVYADTSINFDVNNGSTRNFVQFTNNSTNFNTIRSQINFRVDTDNSYGTFFIDGTDETIIIGNENFDSSPAASEVAGYGDDVKIMLSGSAGTKDSSTRGVVLLPGDVVISGSLYGGSPLKISSDIGLTGSARFKEQSAPSVGSNEAVLYAKDDSGVTKLFMKQSDGTEIGPLGTGGSLDNAYDTPPGGGAPSSGAGAIITVDSQPVQLQAGTSLGFVVTGSTISGHASTNEASGQYSHAEGQSTTASGLRSHAEGYSTDATATASHAEGYNTTASGVYSHAEGQSSSATATAAHAEGTGTTASGQYSHAEGGSTTASGTHSHAEGGSTTASGNYSHAEGESTTSAGWYSHAEGGDTNATADYSHAEGRSNTTLGEYSHAEGYSTTTGGTGTQGRYSHAEGYNTTVLGQYSHVEGEGTLADGFGSHAEGYNTKAIANYSHTAGRGTIASGSAQNVVGKYNKRDNTDSLFVVGFGSGDSNSQRDDMFLVNSGSVVIGSGTLGSDVNFYVTGTAGSKDTTTKGTTVFAGDVVISGTLHGGSPLKIAGGMEVTGSLTLEEGSKIVFPTGAGLTGSLQEVSEGVPYLIAGSNISLLTSSNGQVTITSTGVAAGAGGSNTQVIFNSGGSQAGDSNFTFNSSTDTLTVTNISGSLTQLTDGTPYIIPGTNVSTSTGSNGAITISSTDTNTTYTAGNGLGLSSTEFSLDINGLSADSNAGNLLDSIAIADNSDSNTVKKITLTQLQTLIDTDTTYSTATSSTLGLIKIEDNTEQTVAANAVSSTASRTYGIQLNSSDQAVVNVPWTDTNTTYTAGDGLDLSSTEFSLDLKSSGGLKIDTTELAVEPSDFAGTGLEDDGSDNLRISTAAAGNGLTGGGGSALAVGAGTGITVNANDIAIGQDVGTGADVTFGTVRVDDATASTSTTTGALIVDGGAGISGDVHLGGYLEVDYGITRPTSVLVNTSAATYDNNWLKIAQTFGTHSPADTSFASLLVSYSGYEYAANTSGDFAYIINVKFTPASTSPFYFSSGTYISVEPLHAENLDGFDPTTDVMLTFDNAAQPTVAELWVKCKEDRKHCFVTHIGGTNQPNTTWTDTGFEILTGQSTATSATSLGTDIFGEYTQKIFNNLTIGRDVDGSDKTITFGHSTLKSVIGIDDDQDVFAINTDASFESTNDLEIDSSGNVALGNGNLTIGGDSDGSDRTITFGHSTLKSVIGIDDSQDVFAINTDNSFESDNDFAIDTNGNVTMPNTCFVSAQLSTSQTNIAVGTTTDVVFDTEHFDNRNAYNNSTGVFTAPVSGYYLVMVRLQIESIDSGASEYNVRVVGGDSTVVPQSMYYQLDPNFSADTSSAYQWSIGGTSMHYMDANDTIKIQFRQTGGAQQTDLDGNAGQGIGSILQIRLLG